MIDNAVWTTTDHDTIRRWAEERGGRPAASQTEDVGPDLRIAFAEAKTAKPDLQPLGWDDFFDRFESQGLALLCQSRTREGDVSHFCRLVTRH